MADFFRVKKVKKVALMNETQLHQALLSGDDKPTHITQEPKHIKQVTTPQPHKIILHTVTNTDTFTSLAVKYSVFVDQIYKHNRCTRGTQIFLFKEIKIPVFDQDVLANLEPPGANDDDALLSDEGVKSCNTEQLHKKSVKSFFSDFDNRFNQLKIAAAKTSSCDDDDDATSIRSDTLSDTSSSPLRAAYVPIVLTSTSTENDLDNDLDIFAL